ncbi:MAG: methyl-accepting chemotaxis protein [Nitrospirae bacterium]|nr:methyl-accepting chemotaxis protein [Nitrospirota bacterium]
MFKRLNDMSLKKKLYIISGVMVGATIIGLTIGQISFERVQVGGKAYAQIEKSMIVADDIARLRYNLTLVRANILTMMIEKDRENLEGHKDEVDDLTERVDELLDTIAKSLSAADLSAESSSIAKAQETWNAFKNTRDKELIPFILAGNMEKAKEIVGGVQAERYNAILEETGHTVEKARANVPKMVGALKKEGKIVGWGFIAGGAGFVLFLVFFTKFLFSTVITPISMVSQKSRAMAQGDFSTEDMGIRGRDEIGMMVEDFTRMSKKMAETIGGIKTGMDNLMSSSEELSATAEDLNKGAKDQALQVQQVGTAATEMSQTIMDVAKNAAQAADAAKNSSNAAGKGKAVVETAAQGMLKIADSVKETAKMIEELDISSAQIGEIVAVINDIADQTNLLALNAAIEAARAGEQGRGFAVVADEVRKLAERTMKATEDITRRISMIQADAKKSVESMRQGSDEVDKGVDLAEAASGSLGFIVKASSDAMDMVQRIAAATEEQSAAADEITRNISNISEVVTHTADATEQIKQASHGLARLATEIQSHVEWFKVKE